jgi:hypothetical protein
MGPRESTPGAYCMWAEYLRVNPHSRSSRRRSRCTRPSGPGPPSGVALGPALALALPPPLAATSCQPISKGCARTMASMSSRRALCSAGCAVASHQDENKHRKKRRCHGCSAHPTPPRTTPHHRLQSIKSNTIQHHEAGLTKLSGRQANEHTTSARQVGAPKKRCRPSTSLTVPTHRTSRGGAAIAMLAESVIDFRLKHCV